MYKPRLNIQQLSVQSLSVSLCMSLSLSQCLLIIICCVLHTSIIIMSSSDMSIVYSYQVAYANIKNTKLCPPAGFLGSVREFLGVAKQLLLILFLFPLLLDEIDWSSDNFVQCLLFTAHIGMIFPDSIWTSVF